MGSVSIDLSLANVWQCWFKFKRGKTLTKELEYFNYYLEEDLYQLYIDLNNSKYKHGGYRTFIVNDNKRRKISVASVRDRVAHRLLYEYLVDVYDKTFIYDVWSCRKGKGLVGAIERAQKFLSKYPRNFVWRADIKKFFDNVDHEILSKILFLKIFDIRALRLLKEIIISYSTPMNIISKRESNLKRQKGIPIGNLTSQIFANIYLNELDRYAKHCIKPKAYLRYGDDFVMIADSINQLRPYRKCVINFLKEELRLEVNVKNNIIIKAKHGLKFLGVEIFPKGRRLNKRNLDRISARLNLSNISSYHGLVRKHCNKKKIKQFNWKVLEKLINK